MARTDLTAEQIVDILVNDFIYHAKGGLIPEKSKVLDDYLSYLLAHEILNEEGIKQVRERYQTEVK